MEKKNETSTSEYKRNRASKLSLVFTLDASPKPEEKTLEKREILKFHRSSAASTIAVLVESWEKFLSSDLRVRGDRLCKHTEKWAQGVLVPDFQDLLKISSICAWFHRKLHRKNILQKSHQICKISCESFKASKQSSRIQSHPEKGVSANIGVYVPVNTQQVTTKNLQSHHSRTRDTKSRANDERTVCNGRSDKKESTEKRNSDDCVFKLDSFKTIECQW